MSAILEAALEHVTEGFKIFPVQAGQKKPPIKNWQQWATADAEKIRAHWSAAPQDNIGIACGDNLLVLDVDGEVGVRSLAALEAKHGKLPETCRVSTPSGGQHYYFAGPDVSNTVGALGAALDLRSKGAYVVAPGSRTEKGAYTVAHAAEPAQAPQWLIDLCRKPREKANTGAAVADAAPSAVERAREWLAKQPPAFEGQGGDAKTFATACGLRDLGISEAQAVELLTEWNARCSPPWSTADLRAKAANAFRYAENPAGSKTASAEDFPAVQPSAEPAPTRPTAQLDGRTYPRVKRLSEVTIYAGNGNFVDGLCNIGELFQVIGAPGGRKSQAAGWLAFCVATKQRWLGRETASGAVLYIAAERESEQAKRFTVWACAADLDPDALPLRLMGPGSTLEKLDFAAYVAEQAAALKAETGQECRLIVIDTTMASLPGADLNKTETATRFAQNLKVIAGKVPSAAICAVHHTPKSGAETGMGSQGFDAAFEAALLIEATEAGGNVRQIKGNTTRDWIAPFEWVGEALAVERGAETFLAWRPALSAGTARAPLRKWKAESDNGRAFTALCKLSPQNAPVTETNWRQACREFFGQRLQKKFFDAKTRLEQFGAIEPAGKKLWRRRLEG